MSRSRKESSTVYIPYHEREKNSCFAGIFSIFERRKRKEYQNIDRENQVENREGNGQLLSERRNRLSKREQKHKKGTRKVPKRLI